MGTRLFGHDREVPEAVTKLLVDRRVWVTASAVAALVAGLTIRLWTQKRQGAPSPAEPKRDAD